MRRVGAEEGVCARHGKDKILGGRGINEKKKSSLGRVILPCHHLWTWVQKSLSSFLWYLCLVVPYL